MHFVTITKGHCPSLQKVSISTTCNSFFIAFTILQSEVTLCWYHCAYSLRASVVCPVCKTYDQIYNFPISYEMVKLFLPSVTKSRYLIQGKLCTANLKSAVSIFSTEDDYETGQFKIVLIYLHKSECMYVCMYVCMCVCSDITIFP
jgi:hypothetical protein